MSDTPLPARRVSLVDVLDRVVDRGAIVSGDALISVSDVDLIRIALRLAIVPADRAAGSRTAATMPGRPEPVRTVVREPQPGGDRPGTATRTVPCHGAERGLAQLVLTVVELLRELMDRQAVRRAMRGTLTDEQAERLGVALIGLDEAMDQLVTAFGVDRDDLNLHLGPLGDLL
jgi:Gas vesicle protein K/Gas vesicle protein